MNKKRKFIELGWKILEAKYFYYETDKQAISDAQYDQMEDEYKKLANELGLESSASNMVGFDYDRPSCKLVLDTIKRNKGKRHIL